MGILPSSPHTIGRFHSRSQSRFEWYCRSCRIRFESFFFFDIAKKKPKLKISPKTNPKNRKILNQETGERGAEGGIRAFATTFKWLGLVFDFSPIEVSAIFNFVYEVADAVDQERIKNRLDAVALKGSLEEYKKVFMEFSQKLTRRYMTQLERLSEVEEEEKETPSSTSGPNKEGSKKSVFNSIKDVTKKQLKRLSKMKDKICSFVMDTNAELPTEKELAEYIKVNVCEYLFDHRRENLNLDNLADTLLSHICEPPPPERHPNFFQRLIHEASRRTIKVKGVSGCWEFKKIFSAAGYKSKEPSAFYDSVTLEVELYGLREQYLTHEEAEHRKLIKKSLEAAQKEQGDGKPPSWKKQHDAKQKELQQTRQRVRQMFHQFDSDGSGKLEKREFKKAMLHKEMCGNKAGKEIIQRVWKELSAESGGKTVSESQFLELVMGAKPGENLYDHVCSLYVKKEKEKKGRGGGK